MKMKNCIYFFTGTGNCLNLAQQIAARLPDCQLIAIRKGVSFQLPADCERVGFVYPVYYLGLPAMVADFLKHVEIPRQNNTYYFAVATYGAIAGNSVPEIAQLLLEHGITLNYGAVLKMFSNCVTMYNMSKHVSEITEKSEQQAQPVVQKIYEKQQMPVAGFHKIVHYYHQMQIKTVPLIGQKFHANKECVSCGICQKVCPARNISLEHGKPVFGNQCEHCNACIQHCPKQAINYQNRTQKRRRYTHPKVGYQMINRYYTSS